MTSATEDLIDHIYEAALVPELWPRVLDDMSGIAGSAGGALLIADGRNAPRWTASAAVAPSVSAYIAGGAWRNNKRPQQVLSAGHRGFSRDIDVWTPEEIERYRHSDERHQHGLGWQLGTIIPLPTGEVVIVTLDRRMVDGPHALAMRDAVDPLCPHLARAGLLASRLGLERAKTAVGTLESLNFPAAVAAASGRVLANNSLFDGSKAIVPAALGAFSLSDPAAEQLLRETFAEIAAGASSSLSIPVVATDGSSPSVVHVMPLRGATHDLFTGASVLVVVTDVMVDRVPDLTLLHGLFDLTPAEAKLAAALASGDTLALAAQNQGIRTSTARSYLEAIFKKTGVRKQTQLVALLNNTRVIGVRN